LISDYEISEHWKYKLYERISQNGYRLKSYDIDGLSMYFNLRLKNTYGTNQIKKLDNEELEIFLYSIMLSLRGDWSETESRTDAFLLAVEELMSRRVSIEKEKELLILKRDVEWFEKSVDKDGRTFREFAPRGYYGVFAYLGLNEDYVFSENLKATLEYYCEHYDGLIQEMAVAFAYNKKN
ncbi:MAG: hypothetical protein ACRC0G_16610, partial [Fusobacteriaceae bacterium]